MLVTVVTPALNGMRWLSECIDSTMRQVTPEVEVEHIVVDSGGTDGTPEYAVSRGGEMLATGHTRHACVALATGRPVRVPEEVLAAARAVS